MTVERFDLRAIAPTPWKNGAGLTREIAIGGAGAAFDWRISVAEVDRDAPFSQLPGIDRCIVLLRGAGLRLRSADGSIDHALTKPLAPFRFAGELAVDATLIDGASSDFNAMTRRGVFRDEVTCHRGVAELPGGAITLLLGSAGDWIVDAGASHALGPSQALLWRDPLARLDLRPVRPGEPAALLLVRLWHDRGR